MREEAGYTVVSEKIIAVRGWRRHNVTNYAYGVIKLFVLCRYEGGSFVPNPETTEIGLFTKEALPEHLAAEKSARDQIRMCFDSFENPTLPTLFD